ncbi:hypothetical protein [Bradyrhizobium quebecense]|uniref:Uncharacterized protein n=2 Tax=Bradyrhizobium quebecense TaxID=2748629 RepID=A0ABS3MPZ7_9BRAD|nr:hypothetical protein [Bradyrhizobium quebecense]UGY01389.1 hypothetical protein J4P68_0030370 [Bradyrhizobium quebecense]
MLQHHRIKLQQAGHPRRSTDAKPGLLAVADDIGQIGFELALAGIELGQRAGLRLEAEQPA